MAFNVYVVQSQEKRNPNPEKAENAIIAHLFKKAQAENPLYQTSLAEAYSAMLENPNLAKAADWNPVLADGFYLLYRCCGCGCAPLNSTVGFERLIQIRRKSLEGLNSMEIGAAPKQDVSLNGRGDNMA